MCLASSSHCISMFERWHLWKRLSDFALRGRFTAKWWVVYGWLTKWWCWWGWVHILLRSHGCWIFFLGIYSSCVAAQKSSKHHAMLRAKPRLGGGEGGWKRGGGVRLFVWCRERETVRKRMKRRRGVYVCVCLFHLLISFPEGSVIASISGGKWKAK